jgi:hypothetical protein
MPLTSSWDAVSFDRTSQRSPYTVSSPASALITSLPRSPQIVSPAAVPVIVLSPSSAPNGVEGLGSSGAG